MSKVLYIIGNGFDLHYGLETGVNTFKNILSQKYIDTVGINALELFDAYGVDWGEYEMSLSDLDLKSVQDLIMTYPDYLSDHESDREDCIYNTNMHINQLTDAVSDSLHEMIQNANSQLRNLNYNELLPINECSPIVSFNYTSTLELLYGIKAYHIHGLYEEGDNLIFGYKDMNSKNLLSRLEEDYYVDAQIDSINQLYADFKKKIQIYQLEEYLNQIGDVDIVIVYGHSMSIVDYEYFVMINKLLSPSEWNVSYHGESDVVLFNVRQYSFFEKIKMFQL
ncbi:MAG: bacteriophage abortive infection AbiH family protein [Eubacterium sp.]|nr:bacteriophage abortive infection AbiH family protein [Eubacterium sp.]